MKRNEEFYEGDRESVLSTDGRGETMQEILSRRWSRRGVLGGGLATGMVLTLGSQAVAQEATPANNATPVANGTPVIDATPAAASGFEPITLDEGDGIVVASNHVAAPFLRWGGPIFTGAPELDFDNQTAQAQEQQFGYNCDWIGFFPVPAGSGSSDRGLLVVNHEYTNPELMFPGYLTRNPEFDALPNPDRVTRTVSGRSCWTRSLIDESLA